MLGPGKSSCPTARLLDALLGLDASEAAAVSRMASESVRDVAARCDVLRAGDRQGSVLFLLEGWACRYKQLPDGRRQIVSIMLPGDLGLAWPGNAERLDHAIGALTPVRMGEAGVEPFQAICDAHPGLKLAIARHQRMEMAVQREWTTSLGQRTAIERIAHLFCEVYFRLEAIGAAAERTCDFPLTQSDIADACGLTSVHVNRTVQDLRRDGLIAITRRQLLVPDLPRLMERALFDPNYLHLAQPLGLRRNG